MTASCLVIFKLLVKAIHTCDMHSHIVHSTILFFVTDVIELQIVLALSLFSKQLLPWSVNFYSKGDTCDMHAHTVHSLIFFILSQTW